MKALIIDDESAARQSLRTLLERFTQGVEVIGEAEGVKTGIAAIQQYHPDIVFLDINMPDGTGFDLLEKVSDINFILVFVTAYEQYAIKAIKCSALDYLLKPVDLQELRRTIARIQQINDTPSYQKLVNNYRQNAQTSKLTTLALPVMEGFEIVKTKDIIRCEGEKNYTTFYMQGGRQVVVSRTLKEFEEMLKEQGFLRVFQSHLINLQYVTKYIRGRGGYAIMSDGASVTVSREKKEELLAWVKRGK